MSDSLRQRYERLQVASLLDEHRGLRIVPNWTKDLVIAGALSFQVTGPDGGVLGDTYEVEVRIPPAFPDDFPRVRETGGRIAAGYHKLNGDLLCLGAPTAIRLKLTRRPTLPTLVNALIIPYLYGHSFFSRYGRMPYGELPHGDDGIRENLAGMFMALTSRYPEEFLRLASMKKRYANKGLCPCGSGKRLGRCHNRSVNRWRKELGRRWFLTEYEEVVATLETCSGRQNGHTARWGAKWKS